MLFIELALGFAIGLSLGLLGGGGSILTVPALVYLIGQSPQAAVTTSLAIVGANSLIGASFHRAQGSLNWSVALVFGGAGMLGAYFASGISKMLPSAVLLIAFALLMLVIGVMMLVRRKNVDPAPQAVRPLWVLLASGAGVGLLTGILGVGGGFLIVPALVMLVGLPMQAAVGTSLIIIAMNSLAGLAGHLGAEPFNIVLTLVFTLAGLVGTFAGTQLSKRLPAQKLQKAFAWFVIALAVFLLADNLTKFLRV
jgi:uncharacterized membrane protein YfcA